MRGRRHMSELSVLGDHDRIVARMPRAVRWGDAWFRLDRPGEPHRLVGRIEATRFAGTWHAGRHSGTWRVDVLPAGPHGALVGVVVEGWRGRDGDDVVAALNGRLRDRMEAPLLGRPPIDPAVPIC